MHYRLCLFQFICLVNWDDNSVTATFLTDIQVNLSPDILLIRRADHQFYAYRQDILTRYFELHLNLYHLSSARLQGEAYGPMQIHLDTCRISGDSANSNSRLGDGRWARREHH